MTHILTFLVVFNIAGFTALPLLTSRANPLLWMMPFTSIHRVFILLELALVALTIDLSSSIVLQALYLGSGLCLLNLLFNFRYMVQKVFSGQIPRFIPFPGGILSELKTISGIEFDDGKPDFDIYLSEDSRIMTDLVVAALIFVVIF